MQPKSRNAVGWGLRLTAATIMIIGALPKFTGGAALLAEKIPGGDQAVLAIGLMELTAAALLLFSRTALAGAALVAVLMFGAIGSHLFGPVGLAGDFATMFVLALVAFSAAMGFLVLERSRLLNPAATAARAG